MSRQIGGSKVKLLLLLIRLGMVFGVGVWFLYSLPKVIRYRLTLEVEMNGVGQTGAGVIEERWYKCAWKARITYVSLSPFLPLLLLP